MATALSEWVKRRTQVRRRVVQQLLCVQRRVVQQHLRVQQRVMQQLLVGPQT